MNLKMNMKTKNSILERNSLKGLIFSIILISFMHCTSEQSIKNLSGHYSGKAKIIVSWCKQDSLTFDLKIDNLGVVSGVIGNANIIQGKVKKNTWGSRDYIIEADLSGYIVGKEKITRESISIPFDLVETRLIGGFGTSGSKMMGGKERVILSGANLILIKQ